MPRHPIRLLLILLTLLLIPAGATAAGFARANGPVPVLNSPAFGAVFGGRDGSGLKVDRCGQLRALEFMALPGSVFRVLESGAGGHADALRVVTDEYAAPAGVSLYVDRRLVQLHETAPPPRPRHLPARETIVANLRRALGAPYVWGSNVQEGIPQLLGLYFPAAPSASGQRLSLAGLDCSGLLYQATGGWTPRNTSQLVRFGQGVPVAGTGAGQIADMLQPLDLIVWNGHVIIVLDRETAIESRLECARPGHGGVVATPLAQRLRQLLATRRPADAWPENGGGRDCFVVRRWYRP